MLSVLVSPATVSNDCSSPSSWQGGAVALACGGAAEHGGHHAAHPGGAQVGVDCGAVGSFCWLLPPATLSLPLPLFQCCRCWVVASPLR